MASLTDLTARQDEIRGRLAEIDRDAGGDQFTDTQREEWNSLNEEFEQNVKHIQELEARAERLERVADEPRHVEDDKPVFTRGRKKSRVPDDPTDLAAYRNLAGDLDELRGAYVDGARQIVENMVPAHERADENATKTRLEKLLRETDEHSDNVMFARRFIATSSRTYERAFSKHISGLRLSREEQDAAERAFTIGSTGNYPVPAVWDPTVIQVSAHVVNPMRALARVVTITGNTWYGVTSTGITAAYGNEATEASDNTPTLAQPALNVEKAQAFVPFSIEAGQDWGALAAEMAREFADAKDVLESNKFLHGLGHSSNQPLGLIAAGAATAVVTSASTATIGVADLYSLEAALSPRFRARATIVGNLAAFQKIRQLDTNGGANLWVQLGDGNPDRLLGYPAYQWSDYSSAVTTSASTVLTIGDFSKYVIVDRVGMDVELIPHLFGGSSRYPTGQRGLYAYWRNTGEPVSPGLQANSGFVSLKLL